VRVPVSQRHTPSQRFRVLPGCEDHKPLENRLLSANAISVYGVLINVIELFHFILIFIINCTILKYIYFKYETQFPLKSYILIISYYR